MKKREKREKKIEKRRSGGFEERLGGKKETANRPSVGKRPRPYSDQMPVTPPLLLTYIPYLNLSTNKTDRQDDCS